MSNLMQIERRHVLDSWKDVLFIIVAAFLVAVLFGALTSRAVGKPFDHVWTLTVTEGSAEVMP